MKKSSPAKLSLALILFAVGMSCGKPLKKDDSVELITSATQQDSLFHKLVTITNNTIQGVNDSLAFLVLPVQASCPSCRKKTIDSIMKHQAHLANNHYIIISANTGRKTIGGYFREQEYQLPDIPGKLFLDSVNMAFKYNLYKDKPTIYYSYNRKAYKKVAAIPATVRDDLREFFSGHRDK
jgi:hypothetical protein